MARNATALIASALLLAAVAFLSHDGGGVEAWCLEYQAPDPNACRGKRGLQTCRDECLDVEGGFSGGECRKNPDGSLGECFCLKCVDQPPQPNHVAVVL